MHVHGNRCTHRSLRAAAHAALVALVATGASACIYIDDVILHISDSSVPETGDGSGEPCLSSGVTEDESTCGTCGTDETGGPGGTDAVPTGGVEPGATGTETGVGSTGGGPPTFVCGDAIIAGDEVCDDGVNDGAYGGCMPGCAELAPFCGDGAVDLDHETCDDGDTLDGPTCSSLCERPRCGDGILQMGEDCEGGVAIEATCESLGLGLGGAPGCDSSSCSFDLSLCAGCGNGVIEGDEVCDGAAFGDASCESLGFVGGALACNATCSALDSAGCVASLPAP